MKVPSPQAILIRDAKCARQTFIQWWHVPRRAHILYRAEENAHRIGLILSGRLEMRKYLLNGNVVSLFQRGEGELIGGSIVFSGNPRYPCDVIAREKSLLLWLDRDIVLDVFLKNAGIASNILRISADRIRQLEKRVELFSFSSIQKKIAFSLLNDFPMDDKQMIVLPFPKTTWSEYLNVSRTSLCRELKRMCTREIIQMQGREIQILQREELEAVLSSD